MGKTTLIRQFGSRARYADRCHLVDLSAASDPATSLRAIASALNIDDVEMLDEVLSNWPELILILDNAESSLDGVRTVVQQWHQRGHALRILVTSRQPLLLTGEQQLWLEPLSSPDAIALFEERLRRYDRTLGAAEQAQLPALVEMLDCLPLAIEMAAARCRLLGVERLRERLQEPLKVLRSGARDVPARHRSLRAALMLSWESLTLPQQRLLQQCAVFSSRFSADAIEALFGDEGLWLVESLVEASLLRMDSTSSTPRFSAYIAVSELALESADPAMLQESRRRHLGWLAEQGGALQPGQFPDLPDHPRLLQERESAFAAVRFAMEQGHLRDGARILMWLTPTMLQSNHPRRIHQLLEDFSACSGELDDRYRLWLDCLRLRSLGQTDRNEPLLEWQDLAHRAERQGWPELAALALVEVAHLHRIRLHLADVTGYLHRARALIADPQQHPQFVSMRLRMEEGLLDFWRHQWPEGWPKLLSALSQARDAGGLLWFQIQLFIQLGWYAHMEERDAEAESWFEQALSPLRAYGIQRARYQVLGTLGILRISQDRQHEAIALLSEAMDYFQQTGSLDKTRRIPIELGQALIQIGEHERARKILGAHIQKLRAAEQFPQLFWAVHELACLDAKEGNLRTAQRSLLAYRPFFEHIQNPNAQWMCDLTLGCIALKQNQPARARSRFETALTASAEANRDPDGQRLHLDVLMQSCQPEVDCSSIASFEKRFQEIQPDVVMQVYVLTALGQLDLRCDNHTRAALRLSEAERLSGHHHNGVHWFEIRRLHEGLAATTMKPSP